MSFGDEHGYGGDPGRTGPQGRPGDPYGGSGQTRTRLPDGERQGDGYGGERRPMRASRSLITVVGVVVLLIAAIAFANKGGGGGGKQGSAAGAPGQAAGAAAAPTAPSGVKPVKGKSAATSIPSGFSDDQQGAASAAANYAVALGSDGMFRTATRHAIVSTVYTPTAAAKLQGQLDSAYTPAFLKDLGLNANGVAPQGDTFISRTIPVGTKVISYSSGAAEISVWYTGLVGMAGDSSTDPVSTTWKTSTYHLQWVGGDWKIASDTEQDGPAPVPGDDTASTSEQITKAVEQFGGFTYAR